MHTPGNPKPRWRGRMHQLAFFASIPAGLALVVAARASAEARVAAMVFAACLTGLYGTSALYHRRDWSARAARVMRHLDHSMIFVFIAASYTPFALLAFDGPIRWIVLVAAWGGAVLGLVAELLWAGSPRWLGGAACVAIGWVGILAAPQLFTRVGLTGAVLVLVGGMLYTLGAAIYAAKWPNPFPSTLGFHEIFHLLVVVAAVSQFVAVTLVVL